MNPDTEPVDWTDDDRLTDAQLAEEHRLEAQHAGYCESGTCLQVQVTGDSVKLWESTQPGIHVVTTAASWQQWQDKARAEERARIVAWLREVEASHESFGLADLIERGEFDDVAAGDE